MTAPRRVALSFAAPAAHPSAKTADSAGRRRSLLLAPLALAALLCFAAPSQAAPITIAGSGSAAGQVSLPTGAAVDVQNGDLFVADRNNFRIDRFDAGGFELAWGWGVADHKSQELQVCGPKSGRKSPRCFNAAREGIFTATGPGAVSPESVVVDNAVGSASRHDVYVADRVNRRVSKFSPDGEFIFMLGKGVDQGGGTPSTPGNICTAQYLENGDTCGRGEGGSGTGEYFAAPTSVAVDSEGHLWVGDTGRVLEFDSAGALIEEVPLPAGARSSALAIDPAGGFYVLGAQGRGEVQNVSIAKSGTTFTLSFEGHSTEPIPGDEEGGKATAVGAEAIQAALEALPAIGESNVRVAPASSSGYQVGFIRDLNGRDVPQMSASGGNPPVAVSTEVQGSPGSVVRLDATGTPVETLDDEPGELPEALTVDSAGNVYVGDAAVPYRFKAYDSSGDQFLQFGEGQVITDEFDHGPVGNALALDETHGYLYVANGQGAELSALQRFSLPESGPLIEALRAEDVEPTSATLAASLNPEGEATTYRFQYVSQRGYEEQGDSFEGPHTVSLPEEPLSSSGYEEEEVEAQIEALIPETTYRIRLQAENGAGEVEAQATFATRPAVQIGAQWASDVAARSATLHAQVDPLGGTEGKWWIEYGTTPAYGSATAHLELPASFGELSLKSAFSGLEPATTYHYRFAASDEREGAEYTVRGPDRSFTTQLAGLGFTLADDRAWELVSPPDKHGATIAVGAQGEGHMQAAANGNAVAYLSSGSIEAGPAGNRTPERSTVLSRRGAGGWSSADLTPPNDYILPITVGSGFEYKIFSPDLESALLEPRTATPLSPEASERTPYLRENSEPPGYRPLVTAAEVPPGTKFGAPPGEEDLSSNKSAVHVEGATPELSHVVLASAVPLAAGDAEGSVYEWSAAAPPAERLTPLSVLPEGEHAVSGELGSRRASVRGAISADGSRFFWSSLSSGGEPVGLYLRDAALGQTVRLDAEQPGSFGTGEARPIFQGADEAGAVALFTDTQNLTEDASESGADLYRWRAEGVEGCEEAGGCLADLSASGDPTEAAEVLGRLPGVSGDGSRAYLIARGVLASNSVENGAGPETAQAGKPNLYLWQRGEGMRFIATLSEGDEHDWGVGLEPAAHQSAAASPSGRYLAFMSERSLTGYDNRDAKSGEADQEVFRYDAEADGGAGGLICASCNPSGARPSGVHGYLVPGTAPFYDPQEIWLGQPLAALLPDATKLGIGTPSLYRPRAVHDDGRLFFNAFDSLVSADSNANWDVYEYEPGGEGTCTASSGDAATARSAGGCVSLISSGSGAGESAFLDASEGGGDVFFFSSARLSVLDEDEAPDVYDARVEGTPATLSPVAECQGEACQPPALPPASKTPASAAFRGPGNPRGASHRRCPKGKHKVKRRGKTRCVKKRRAHRKRHRAHRHRRHHGRAHR